MKRFFLLSLFLCLTLGTWANFTPDVPDGSPQGSTVIFFDLKLNGQVIAPNEFSNNYQVAAFIDGKCRAVADVQTTPAGSYLQLEVPGNYSISEEDNNKEITFKVFMIGTQCTYELTSDPRVVFGSQATYGKPSTDHVQLTGNYPSYIQLRDITMNINESVTLKDYIAIRPSDATLPLEARWQVSDQRMASIADGKLTARTAGTTTYTLTIPNGTDATGTAMSTKYMANLTIKSPATAINVTQTTYEVNMGQDRELNAFLATAYTLVPVGSTDVVSWVIGDESIIGFNESNAQFTLKQPGQTTMTPVIYKSDGTIGLSGRAITITVKQLVERISASTTSITCNVGDNDIVERLEPLITFYPSNATNKTMTWNIAQDGVLGMNNGTITAMTVGQTQLIGATTDGSNLTIAFTVIVEDNLTLTSFIVTVTPEDKGIGGTVKLTPVPATAVYDMSDFQLTATATAGTATNYGDWTPMTFVQDGQDPLSYLYSAQLPGQFTVQVMKGEVVFAQSNSIEVPFVAMFETGWQWKSNNYIDVTGINGLTEFFGSGLTEARTKNALLFNDPSWGYVGSMLSNGINKTQMYKVNMTTASKTYITGGSMPGALTVTLEPGWNWVGSPYFYNRKLATAIDAASLPAGLVIQGKSGSAEVANGQWNGSLTTINSGEGYLVFNPNTTQSRMTWATEIGSMSQGNDAAGSRAQRVSIWNCDASRFANNMTMVATLSNIEQPEQYTLGAFVDGECRGEGEYIDGRMYITAHVNDGEQVSFVLYNEWTGDYLNVEQTFTARTRIGSVTAPIALTTGTTTGISTATTATAAQEVYDLQGRKVTGSQRNTIHIVRMRDGSVRKITK